MRLALKAFWTPVGAGPKSEQEVDALALYLFGDSAEGRQALREIDATISELPGLDGLTLLEDALDRALERTARDPRYGGIAPSPNGAQRLTDATDLPATRSRASRSRRARARRS